MDRIKAERIFHESCVSLLLSNRHKAVGKSNNVLLSNRHKVVGKSNNVPEVGRSYVLVKDEKLE